MKMWENPFSSREYATRLPSGDRRGARDIAVLSVRSRGTLPIGRVPRLEIATPRVNNAAAASAANQRVERRDFTGDGGGSVTIASVTLAGKKCGTYPPLGRSM